ncbi:MAG: site-2 protease family protein [Deltaproteobacteria bacterium]|nr:site-2 protease family protein [Deltaproteobacteria bacterium]
MLSAAISVAILIVAAVLHEISHGLAAYKLGDNTARNLGRITLNPIKHIDPFMTLILPAALVFSGSPIIFGGAKPVPVNPFNFKNPRRDMALVAAAGPISNFLLAAAAYFTVLLMGKFDLFDLLPEPVQLLTLGVILQWIMINIVLGIFNLFPVPPLDGGRIVTGLLPLKIARPYASLERYGILIVFALLYLGVVDDYMRLVLSGVFNALQGVLP